MTDSLSAALAVLFVDHGVRLVQTADGLTQKANDRLREAADAVTSLLLATDFTDAADVTDTLTRCKAILARAYQQVTAESVNALADLPAIEAAFVVGTVNKQAEQTLMRTPRLSVTEPTLYSAPLSAWWAGQESDTQAKLVHTIRAGIAGKLTAEQIAAHVTSATGPLAAATRYAETLTHTAVQRVAMDARNAVLRANKAVVQGLQVVATLDSRTCAQCLAYDGATYTLEGEPTGSTTLPWRGGPAYHMNCRCTVVGIFLDDAAPEPLTAQRWLDRKSAKEQDEMLGKGRAALYRKGNLTLRDLISGTGKQLSLADLREKYNQI